MKPDLMKTKGVSFRLREQDYSLVEDAAQAAGKPIAEWARDTLLQLVREPDSRPIEPRNAGESADSLLTQIVLEEVLAFRSIMISLLYANATGQRPSEEAMKALIGKADQSKGDRAREVIGEAIRRFGQPGENPR